LDRINGIFRIYRIKDLTERNPVHPAFNPANPVRFFLFVMDSREFAIELAPPLVEPHGARRHDPAAIVPDRESPDIDRAQFI
jgi:hypothetical protein